MPHHSMKQDMSFREIAPAVGLMLISCLLLFWLTLKPADAFAPQLAFFDPRLTQEDILKIAAQSGANILRFGVFPFTLFVQANDVTVYKSMADSGAWFWLDASRRGGCSGLRSLIKGKK